ncbi:MAG: PrsW family glutamic-type intramembrane protease [Candidatus Nealsonbacteria bacterium]|nr:PrsW family glutamic-type intramembrane protease [Candidatus Nealsonbacteria bacterium]
MLKKLNNQLDFYIIFIFVFLSGLILPVILIPVIKLTGYSEIIEEITKAVVIFFVVLKLSDRRMRVIGALAFGFLFGLSESFFYLSNIIQSGDFSVFWQRFLSAVPMHMITVLVILLPSLFRKKYIIIGLGISIFLHLLFNSFL